MTATQTHVMTGKHIDIWRKVLIASAVSGQHCLIQTPPGEGKSRVVRSAQQMFNPNERIFLRLAASTPPEKVEGMLDPAAAIKSPPEFIISRVGTAFDPLAKCIVLDEMWRTNDAVFDVLLDALDRIDLPESERPVVWATTNFVSVSQRTEAVADRIALWVLEQPVLGNVGKMVGNIMADLTTELGIGDLPSPADVQSARNAVPSKKSIEAVSDVITNVTSEALKKSMRVNPRHIDQWTRILFRVSTLYYGSPDFDAVHKEASFVMKYAYTILDNETKAKWEQVVGSSVDIVGSAIDAVLQAGLAKMSELRGAQTAANKMNIATEIGNLFNEKKREIEEIGGTDPRVSQAFDELAREFSKTLNPNGG